MKKRILSLVIMLLCVVLGLSGCGLGSLIEKGIRPNPSLPDNPTDPTDPNNPDDPIDPSPAKLEYTVSVFYGNSPYLPGDQDVIVVWQNDVNVKRVTLGADGTASAGELDGSYAVYLEGLPDAYTYNPSAYHATADERNVTILLTTVREPESGNGAGLYLGEGCYFVRYDGTYRAKIKRSGEYVYYEYKPTVAGVYSVESWVNAYANDVNPLLILYGGTVAFKWLIGTRDDGGFSTDGGYTKNFRYEYTIGKDSVGSSFTFAICAESTTLEFPLTVDFAITYEGAPALDGNTDIRTVRATEAYVKAANKKPNETLTFADFGTKTFNADNFKFNEDTGFYHYYSEDLFADGSYGYGENYGPILCCALNVPIPCYLITTLYSANATGLNNGSNYLILYQQWLEEEQKYVAKDYTAFIREDYYRVCNSDGVCYVTEELRQFLQAYAENHSLYTDGVSPADGSPEAAGYFAKNDALWLFACCVYL